jgi:hypothetical protein
MPPPARPKIYHIVHVDRLASVLRSGGLLCDAAIAANGFGGTTIGMSEIKRRRLQELQLASHPGLFIGQCVPFYFCPRSIMLFLIYCANHPELNYKGGQQPIVHLEADLHRAIEWAEENEHRWAFTLSNAGAYYVEDRSDLAQLGEINWDAVATHRWAGQGVSRQIKEGKQAEFLVEMSFPWHLVERIGVCTPGIAQQVGGAMNGAAHRPTVEVRRDWYY